MTGGHLPTASCGINELPPEPTRTGRSCIQTKKTTKNTIIRHGYVGWVMSDRPVSFYTGPIDVGPHDHYVGQVNYTMP